MKPVELYTVHNNDFRSVNVSSLRRITKEALSCINTVAKSRCGEEAAKHYNKVNLQMLKPIAEDIHCDLGNMIMLHLLSIGPGVSFK